MKSDHSGIHRSKISMCLIEVALIILLNKIRLQCYYYYYMTNIPNTVEYAQPKTLMKSYLRHKSSKSFITKSFLHFRHNDLLLLLNRKHEHKWINQEIIRCSRSPVGSSFDLSTQRICPQTFANVAPLQVWMRGQMTEMRINIPV
jgi:hypothetical protein